MEEHLLRRDMKWMGGAAGCIRSGEQEEGFPTVTGCRDLPPFLVLVASPSRSEKTAVEEEEPAEEEEEEEEEEGRPPLLMNR